MARGVVALLALWIGIGDCSQIQAQITAFWQHIPITPQAIASDPSLANMQSWDLMTTTTGNWASAGLRADLPPGFTFYKHSLGGITRPDPASFNSSPALEFTTFVSSPSDDGTNNGTFVGGGHPQSHPITLGDPNSPTPGEFSVVWSDFVVDPADTYQIARLTFPLDVIPEVVHPPGEFSSTSQVDPDTTTIIPDIPEPATLGLLVVIGMGLLRCQQNRAASCPSHRRSPNAGILSQRADVNTSPTLPIGNFLRR